MIKTQFVPFRLKALAVLIAVIVSACGGGGSDTPAPPPITPPPSGLSYASPQTYTVGTAITALAPTVTGVVTSYAVSSLPAGLSLNTTSGQITGTPTAAAATASYTITAQNSGGSTSFSLTLTVNAPVLFWLEPTTSTLIGVGQAINVYPANKTNSADPYPAYVDPSLITWSSSQPAVASINSSGMLVGLSEGTTLITAQYQTRSSQLAVQVSGTYTSRSVAVTGQGTRQYSIYTPPFGTDTNPHPAIFSLHGGGGTAMIQASTSTLNKLAQAQKAYVVYLEGTGTIQTHNAGACCGSAQTNNTDDVVYATKVLDDIIASDNINVAKVFATGFSNGGMMSHRLACAMSDRFAAIAAVGGGSAQFDKSGAQYYACNPTRRIPVLHIHVTNDRNYPFDGGPGDGLSSTNFYSIDSTIADWIARNNVTNQATIETVTSTTTCYRYSTVADTSKTSAPVALCKITPVDVYDSINHIVFGGGHSWPGGVRSPAAKSDVPITDFNANAYIWAFFGQ
jgi:polyhydroxybutyrate depolymerase